MVAGGTLLGVSLVLLQGRETFSHPGFYFFFSFRDVFIALAVFCLFAIDRALLTAVLCTGSGAVLED